MVPYCWVSNTPLEIPGPPKHYCVLPRQQDQRATMPEKEILNPSERSSIHGDEWEDEVEIDEYANQNNMKLPLKMDSLSGNIFVMK